MFDDGILEECSSPWGSPVTIVARKDGQPRLCVDLCSMINKPHIRKTCPTAYMEDDTDTVGGAHSSVLLMDKAPTGRYLFTLTMSSLQLLSQTAASTVTNVWRSVYVTLRSCLEKLHIKRCDIFLSCLFLWMISVYCT